ncbi:ABC transporter substrate-binding protein [Luteipulveratus mongoliensis]|uniref:Solute-binding protein family 3/N-terminal domain-containing protein n=1 Tax=Luteipulveratus mongoliensis TaxID=571913 RepID=A0A0K1JFR4_9MICO|nr:ABC transporter substrate-binding protein [Luteipulveratus mongoliensis]AKU15541.1 hypothetical protein VV02_06170 [Luteipulveratus mongoliensis]
MSSLRSSLPLLAAVVVTLASCSEPADSASSPTDTGPTQTKGCDKDSLRTVEDGRLTIGTSDPAYAPWFVDNDPGNGQGFESGMGYRLAQHLGYDPADVRWVRVPMGEAMARGPKSFDLALVEASITPKRRAAVDFSTPYHAVRQAVVTYEGSPIAGKHSVAELKGARLAAAQGTTSYDAITRVVAPTQAPVAYPTVTEAGNALAAHQVDGLVTDVPTAIYLSTAVVDDASVLGELPAGSDEQVGAVLAKSSSLTQCVSTAVRQLKADGTLDRLGEHWLSSSKEVPTLS